MSLRILSLIFFCFAPIISFAQLSVNEIMASNSTTIADNANEFDDWVEIYNAGNVSVNLAGLYITDDPTKPTKWKIPNTSSIQTTINAKGYLLLWLDGDTGQGAHHASFKLSSGGEHFAIINTDGSTVIDSVTFGPQTTDISYARSVDGTGDFEFQTPTPNATNNGNTIDEKSTSPQFTIASGFYANELTVGITATNSAEIRYEIGGKVPTSNSQLYSTPIAFDTTTIIRAIAIESGKAPSDPVTNSYLFESPHTIPVISFVMDPDSLFDYDKGMYVIGDSSETTGVYPFKGANFWEEFEYPMNLEYFNEMGNPEFEFMAEASIAGNFSRAFPKKSFTINNNSEFGLSELQYPLFAENSYTNYDGFTLRAGAEERSRLLNELLREINLHWNHKNVMQAYKFSALYINGQYWGTYNIYERKNDDFVESRFGFSDIDMIKDYDKVIDGDFVAYQDLISNLNNSELQGDAFFEYVSSAIDLESFTDHWVYQVYTSHGDPNNLRYFRPRVQDGKWYFISHDFDWWRNLGTQPNNYFPSFKHFISKEPFGYWLLGRMIENPTYRNIFLNRFADMLNTAFKPDYILGVIADIEAELTHEMPRDIARWDDDWYDNSGPTDFDMSYIKNLLDDYIVDYPLHLYSEIADTLGNDTVRVALEFAENGTISLNSISPEIASSNTWSGLYFSGTDISLSANPELGYQVAQWKVNGENYSTQNNITLPLTTTPVTISVTFAEISTMLVINEINYNSSSTFDTGDWIEIYNPTEASVDVSGWVFKDDDDSHNFVIPNGTTIPKNSYLVLAADAALLKSTNEAAKNVIGDFNFGLSGTSDTIRLFNEKNALVDQVTYADKAPWPTEADGDGATLELSSPELDNSLAENWVASTRLGGTPGWENGTLPTSNENDGAATPKDYILAQNYPNPFNPTTNISFKLPDATNVELSVFNMLGQKVRMLISENLPAGNHTVTFDATNLSSGIYLYQLKTPKSTLTHRMVLVK